MAMSETLPRIMPGDAAGIAEAAALLRRGEAVAFPTETVYGLGADALNAEAVGRVYDAKGRPAINPLIVHVPDVAMARALVRDWPPAAERLARRWWPGPLTLVLPRGQQVPDIVTAGLDTVALRMPAHPVARALLRAVGRPLAAPSANPSGGVSPTTAAHVARGLAGRIPLVLDGGPTDVGIESTVIDLATSPPRLLRPGAVSRAELETELGPIAVADAAGGSAAPRPSPGMLERHYAPRAPVVIYPAGSASPARAWATRDGGGHVGAIVLTQPPPEADLVVRLPDDPAGYARMLYQALHQLDDQGAALILVEHPPAGVAWDAIRDRLRRAAHP